MSDESQPQFDRKKRYLDNHAIELALQYLADAWSLPQAWWF